MADEKSIGTLTLNIKPVQDQIKEVNEWLGKIGANINLEDKLSQKVSAALQKLVNEAKQAGEEASKALAEGASKSKFDTIYEKMEQKMLAFENKMQAEAEKAIAKADQRAEREAAATERAEERKRQAREKQEQRYQQVWDKAARDREAQDAKEAANIDKQIAKYEAQDAKRAASAEKAAEREEQARAKKEAAYNDMWHRAEQQREQELAAEEAKLEQEVAKAEEAAQRKAQIEEEAAAKAAAARAKQEADYQLVWDKASYEQRQAAIRQYQQDIENYSKALAAYFTEIDNLQKQLVSGKVTEGSERYKAFTDNIARLKEEAQQAGASLDQAGKQTAASMQNVQTAVANLSKSSAAIRDSKTPDYLKQVTAAYNTLRDAINNYNIAKKANNTSDMQTWQAEIDKQMGVISGVEQIVGSLNIEENVREQIVLKLQEAKTLQDGFTKGVVGGTTAASELESQMTGLLTRMFSIMAVIRTVSNLIKNTVEYVSEYSDKMNEIQMITLKTDEEVSELAETYRDLASLMNVSSLDMADAAIYFTRQGLEAAEIEKRLKNVTMYAKAANVEFKDASEIITAVVNSMGLAEQEMEDGRNAAQRVADVFLKVGDSAATSGQEIGEAMQKAAASAGAFGMSFEWLASYIATVSETTRQEARTIGTALNTIIARLHQIKQQGYNSDDETKINDVQKALANIGVTLMDNNNEWRDMDTIFQEIGEQWDTLDGKTKSYIATTMAGVKQQNVFLALMNDLGKENLETTEHESRAWELYAKAIDSAGTAEDKYAVYKDSVAASQERLNIAQEKFYSLLDSSVIKQWNDFFAGWVNMITDGAKALSNINIIIPVAIGLVTAIGVAIHGMNLKMKETITLTTMLENHPIIMAIGAAAAAITILISAFSALGSAISTTEERLADANNRLSESAARIDSLNALSGKTTEMFENIGEKADGSTESIDDYNSTLAEISKISPEAKKAVDDLKEGLIKQAEAADKVNEALQKQIDLEKKVALGALRDKYANYQAVDGRSDLYKEASTWDASVFESDEKFAATIKKYITTPMFTNRLGEEVRQYVIEQIATLNEESEDDRWAIIGQRVWEKYFSGGDIQSIDEIMKQNVNEIIDDLYETMSIGLDDVDAGILRQRLINELIGSDDEVDYDEWRTAGEKASKLAMEMWSNGFEATDSERLKYVVRSIFGDELLNDTFSDEYIENIVKNSPDLADMIVEAYETLLKAGFEGVDIAGLYDEDTLIYQLKGMVELMQDTIKKSLLDLAGEDNQIGINFLNFLDELDFNDLSLIQNLLNIGTGIEEIEQAASESESVDEFREKLATLGQELGTDVPEAAEEAEKTFADLIKDIKSFVSEVDDINGIIETLKNGEEVKISDMLDIASSHPEIMAFLNDANELINQLERIKQESKNGVVSDVRNMILGNEDVMKNSPFSEYMTDDIKTLAQYANTLDETSAEMDEVSRYVELATAQFLAATGQVDKIDVNKIKELQSILFGRSNVDLNNRPTIDASKLTEAGWSNAGEGIATVFSSSYNAGKEGIKWNEDVIVSVTPILENGEVMSPDALDKYMDELFAKSGNIDELRQNDTKGLVIDVTAVADNESFADAESRVESLMVLLHKLQEVLYGKPEGEKSWLEEQVEAAAKTAELEWAKSNAYTEQMGELAYTVQNEGVREAIEVWDTYDEKLQKAIAETYPDLAKSILEAKQAIDEETGSEEKQAKATDSMTKAISKYQKYATAQNFTKTYAAIQKLEKGTISAAEAFDTFYSETDKITKAQEEINTATDKMADGVELAVSDVNDLAGVLGISADQILQDFPGAVDMFNQLIGRTGDLQAAFDALNEAAFIRITGVSEADFSAIMNGLDVVVDKASETVKMLEATGQWKVETIKLEGMQNVLENGKLVQKVVHGFQDVLRPTGNNPYKGTNKSNYSGSNNKKSGGGGGGGSNKNSDSNQMTEVELMLNRMEQMQAIIESQQGFYSAQSNYYKQTGHLQGVIGYSQKEIQVLEAQNDVLKQNIEQIDKYRQQKEAELEALDVSDEKYEEVRDDLDKLQKAHQQYTKQVIENETAIDQLNETIKETQKQIRDMQIKIREQIYKAIEDREKKAKNMLQNEISMENTILDIIKRKYEIERDKIIENTDARITALQEEKDLLSEQLRIRKEMAEEEDKAAKLAQLEANYNRIVADPTRAKEAQKIQDEISSLRKEMAWDAAEKEVKAQQDSIDQQITSLEDYKQYIEEYYEDLFAHPAKLIEEMRNIITRTDDEILDWLKENSEEYAASSENTQRQMVDTWSNTLDEMRGRIKTYWDEVEDIIAGGDDNIVQFLIDNSEDYAKAGKLQAEKYVEEWQEELEDLHKALEAAFTIDAPDYVVMDPSAGGSSGGSSGGGGGGSSGGNQKNQQETQKEDHGYSFVYKNKRYSDTGYVSKRQAQNSANNHIDRLRSGATKAEADRWESLARDTLYVYKNGGIADFTGPAWLDGSKRNPERVLSPYQTKLFESMVQALEKMSTISIPSMPNFGGITAGSESNVSVGDIIVNVDNLDTDDDYEELADKVSEVLMERIGRTAVVGGLRINSI